MRKSLSSPISSAKCNVFHCFTVWRTALLRGMITLLLHNMANWTVALCSPVWRTKLLHSIAYCTIVQFGVLHWCTFVKHTALHPSYTAQVRTSLQWKRTFKEVVWHYNLFIFPLTSGFNNGLAKEVCKTLGDNHSLKKVNLESPGIDTGTPRMLSERSTIWANSPLGYVHVAKSLTSRCRSLPDKLYLSQTVVTQVCLSRYNKKKLRKSE